MLGARGEEGAAVAGSRLAALKAKLAELEAGDAVPPASEALAPIPVTNYTTAYLRRPDDEDRYYSARDDDYPFEAHPGYGEIVRAEPLPVPAANFNRVLFAEPGRLDQELATVRTLIDRRHGGAAAARRGEITCEALRQEVAELRGRLAQLLARANVDAGALERSFAVPEPPERAVRLAEAPQQWKREEDDAAEYGARVDALRKFAQLHRLKETLDQLDAQERLERGLRAQIVRLGHDCDECRTLLEEADMARQAAAVAVAEAQRSHADEESVFSLQRAAAADEQRALHHLPRMDRRADAAVARSYAVSSLRLQRALPCDDAIDALSKRLSAVEARTFADIAEAQHAWRGVLEAAVAARAAVHEVNVSRDERRRAAERRYELIRDAASDALIAGIPLKPQALRRPATTGSSPLRLH